MKTRQGLLQGLYGSSGGDDIQVGISDHRRSLWVTLAMETSGSNKAALQVSRGGEGLTITTESVRKTDSSYFCINIDLGPARVGKTRIKRA